MKFNGNFGEIIRNIFGNKSKNWFKQISVLKCRFEDKLNHDFYIKYLTISILFLLFTFFSIPKLNAQVDKKLVKEIEKLKERMELDPNFYWMRSSDGRNYLTAKFNKPRYEQFIKNEYEIISSIVLMNDQPTIPLDSIFMFVNDGYLEWKNIRTLPNSSDTDLDIVYYPNKMFLSSNHDKEYDFDINKEMIPKNTYLIETSEGPGYLFEFRIKNTIVNKHGVILENHFTTLRNKLKNNEIGFVIDERDNQKYKYVKIDDLYWMSENLKFQTPETRLLEGEVYYTYYDAVSACPKGWHLPSDIEWKKLEKYLGVNDQWLDYLGSEYSRGDGVGEKQIGLELATNRELGFLANYSGYPSSFRVNEKGSLAYFWTRTKQDEVNAIIRVLGTDFTDGIIRDKSGVKNSFSCRCVKDTDINSISDNNQKIKAYLQKESEGKMTADDFYERSIEFLIIGEESRSFDDIENALKLDNSNLEYKLFKAQLLYLYQFNKEASQIRSLLNEYLTNINNNEFAYYLAYKSELYDYVNNEMKATNDKLRKQKALNYLESAIKLDPKNPYYMELKSKIHISNQEYGEAIKVIAIWLSLDPKNGEAHNWLGVCKLKNFHEKNKSNKVTAPEWCGMIAGCHRVTAVQLKEVCSHFYKAINYGFSVDPDYFSLCGELKSAELLEKHRPIVHIGPRGGRYTISSSGNKVYLPRK
jgi:uncharacterized protein (TIGR02145 family)